MEAEVSTQIGAELYERSEDRTAQRNGYRTRTWDTRVGTVELRVPKIAPGSYFPSLLEPRRRAERALAAVIQEAYVKGISTRKVDDLVRALGMDGISRSEVSRVCKELDKEVEAFLTRPVEGEHPYVWLDATFHKVREGGRVIPMATVVAVGVNTDGWRQVLGIATGPSEDHAFWTAFLRSLLRRGLKGVSPFVICEAWNGNEREFIYQVKPEGGQALIRPIAQMIDEHEIHLAKKKGERVLLSLNTANELMAGYYS
jgi:transposase-like protein